MPFSKPVATNELFETANMKELSRCMELALAHEDLALVTGTPGSGKSSAIRYFMSKLDAHAYPIVYITAENYKIGDIAKLLLNGLSCPMPYTGNDALRSAKHGIAKLELTYVPIVDDWWAGVDLFEPAQVEATYDSADMASQAAGETDTDADQTERWYEPAVDDWGLQSEFADA
jgi:hypothetical protein